MRQFFLILSRFLRQTGFRFAEKRSNVPTRLVSKPAFTTTASLLKKNGQQQ
jgi:hypothetical protein